MTLRSSTLIMGLLVAIGATTGMLACSSSEEQPAEEAAAPPPERSVDQTQPAPVSSKRTARPLRPTIRRPRRRPMAAEEAAARPAPAERARQRTRRARAIEKEGNDTEQTANTMPAVTTSLCGSLSSKTDVDFFKFTLPAETTGFAMGLNYSKAGLKIEVSVDGKKFNVGDTPELIPGKEYVVKVFTTGDGGHRFSMTIDK
jgi:hypothetical protein